MRLAGRHHRRSGLGERSDPSPLAAGPDSFGGPFARRPRGDPGVRRLTRKPRSSGQSEPRVETGVTCLGDERHGVPSQVPARMKEVFTDQVVVELPKAKHYIQEDAPDEIITAIINRFASRCRQHPWPQAEPDSATTRTTSRRAPAHGVASRSHVWAWMPREAMRERRPQPPPEGVLLGIGGEGAPNRV